MNRKDCTFNKPVIPRRQRCSGMASNAKHRTELLLHSIPHLRTAVTKHIRCKSANGETTIKNSHEERAFLKRRRYFETHVVGIATHPHQHVTVSVAIRWKDRPEDVHHDALVSSTSVLLIELANRTLGARRTAHAAANLASQPPCSNVLTDRIPISSPSDECARLVSRAMTAFQLDVIAIENPTPPSKNVALGQERNGATRNDGHVDSSNRQRHLTEENPVIGIDNVMSCLVKSTSLGVFGQLIKRTTASEAIKNGRSLRISTLGLVQKHTSV